MNIFISLVLLSSINDVFVLSEDTLAINYIHKQFQSLLTQALPIIKNDTCREQLKKEYNNIDDNTAFKNLYSYSSHSKNDIGSQRQCSQLNENSNTKYNFYLLNVFPPLQNDSKSSFDLNNFKDDYLLGFCLRNICDIESLTDLVYEIDNSSNFFFGWEKEKTKIQVIDVDKENLKIKDNFTNPFFIICVVILILHMIFFILMNVLPASCIKKKVIVSNNLEGSGDFELEMQNKTLDKIQNIMDIPSDSEPSVDNIKKPIINELNSCFDLSKNGEEFFNKKKETKTINNSGLGYVYELRGVMLFFTVIGFVYLSLIDCRMIIYQESKYNEMISSFLFPLVLFGIRFAPRILFSCSGYMLVYKMFCYMDERVEKITTKKVRKETGNDDSILKHNISEFIQKEHEKDQNIARIGWLFSFIFSQLHKYIIAIFLIVFYRYVLLTILSIFGFIKSTLIYFKVEILDSFSILDILGHFLLYQSFNIQETNVQLQNSRRSCILPIFWMFCNEIFFFIITSPIIFLCYKKKIKINIVFFGLVFSFISLRAIIYYFYLAEFRNNSTMFLKEEQNGYGLLYLFPIYNYSYFLIGCIFGLINYSLQKGISADDVLDGDKGYLQTSVFFAETFRDLKGASKFIVMTILLIVIIGITFFMQIFIHISSVGSFLDNKGVNAFYLFDIDFNVIFIHLLALLLYINGSQLLGKLFNGKFSNVLHNTYLNLILNGKIIVYIVICQSETMWSLELSTIVVLTAISSIIIFTIGVIFSIVYEFPLKKLNKTIVNRLSHQSKIKKR